MFTHVYTTKQQTLPLMTYLQLSGKQKKHHQNSPTTLMKNSSHWSTSIQPTVENNEGRYVVRLPLKSVPFHLGGSRGQACRRFYQNKHSLQHKGRYDDYTKALQEYAELGHAEPVPAGELGKLGKPESATYYLPSHGVVKQSSTTTKLRIVFDASAKTTSGVSLIDTLLPGPNLYPLLTNVILAFRSHNIGLSADISKMFREIGLHQNDRDLHRFLQPGSRGGGGGGREVSWTCV